VAVAAPAEWRAGRLQANNAHVLREAALRGEGIVLERSFLVGLDVAAGWLVPWLPDHLDRNGTAGGRPAGRCSTA
jgi:DNA-binding transcriptional LysR family regulator